MERSLQSLPDIMRTARDGFGRLTATVEAFTGEHMREDSLLPGWTRAHLATHIARNADSHVRLLEAAAEGRIVEQYAGGKQGRAADIERGAGRDAAAIIGDVRASGERLFAVWGRLAPEVWTRTVGTNRGEMPAWRTAWSRLREIEVHHTDLGAGYLPPDWPEAFVDAFMDEIAQSLLARVPEGTSLVLRAGSWTAEAGAGRRFVVEGTKAGLLAWMLGRERVAGVRLAEPAGAPLPSLAPWG